MEKIEEIIKNLIINTKKDFEKIKAELNKQKIESAEIQDVKKSLDLFNFACKKIIEVGEKEVEILELYEGLLRYILGEKNTEFVSQCKGVSKIGSYVKNALIKLFLSNSFSASMIDDMCTIVWSKQYLKLGYPLLKVIDNSADIHEQIKINGNNRYWKESICINGRSYVMCSQWFESQRSVFNDWLGIITNIEDNIGTLPINDEVLSLNLFNEFTGRKPNCLKFLSEEYKVNSWKELYLSVGKKLSLIDKDKFIAMAFDPNMQGRNMDMISLSKNKMRSPANVEGTNIYFETNISANNIRKRIELMLNKFNIELFEIEILCSK